MLQSRRSPRNTDNMIHVAFLKGISCVVTDVMNSSLLNRICMGIVDK